MLINKEESTETIICSKREPPTKTPDVFIGKDEYLAYRKDLNKKEKLVAAIKR